MSSNLISLVRIAQWGNLRLAVFASGLPWLWKARESFCTRTMCIRTPWIGRILVFALMTPFAIIANWARHEFVRLRQTHLSR
ncbi:MAG: hypothetical protein WCA21_07925 [Terracidiphilus sp.]